MTFSNNEEETTIYKVVINHEEQYSIWPANRENPLGWRDAGKSGLKTECLAYIKDIWTDMRPTKSAQTYGWIDAQCDAQKSIGNMTREHEILKCFEAPGKRTTGQKRANQLDWCSGDFHARNQVVSTPSSCPWITACEKGSMELLSLKHEAANAASEISKCWINSNWESHSPEREGVNQDARGAKARCITEDFT